MIRLFILFLINREQKIDQFKIRHINEHNNYHIFDDFRSPCVY